MAAPPRNGQEREGFQPQDAESRDETSTQKDSDRQAEEAAATVLL
jgi:hypothetical protein